MKAAIPLLFAAALAGCAAMDPGTPAVAPLDAARLGLRDGAIAWPSGRWWTRYGDSQLNLLVEQALAGNPSMDAARARLNMADAAVRGAQAVRLPRADASSSITRERFSANYIYPPPYGGSMLTEADLRLNLGLDLDLWGRNRARYAAALSERDAAQADVHMARNALAGAVAQSYYKLQGALAQQAVLEDMVRQQQNVLDITRERVRAGLDTQIEAKQADSSLSSTRVQLSQAAANARLLRHQISALLGEGPERGAQIGPVTLEGMPPDVPATLPLELLARRPDVIAARERAQAAAGRVSAAKAEFFPNVNLTAFVGVMSLGLGSLLDGASKTYGVGPAVSLPIFHGGALNAQLDARRAERDLAIADYNQTLLAAVREVADSAASIQALAQQADDQAESLRAIASAYQIAVDRYRSGLGNFIQVLLAQNEVQKQAMLDADLRARAYALDAQLATALGGGYLNPSNN